MSNMSYCRFHNTLGDLRDCFECWEDPCSEAEAKAKERLLSLVKTIAAEYGDMIEVDDE